MSIFVLHIVEFWYQSFKINKPNLSELWNFAKISLDTLYICKKVADGEQIWKRKQVQKEMIIISDCDEKRDKFE